MLSARTPAALRAQAARLDGVLAAPEGELGEVSRALATTRTAFEHRAVVTVTGDRDEALAALRALAAGESAPGLLTGRASAEPLAFLFSGQGSQR